MNMLYQSLFATIVGMLIFVSGGISTFAQIPEATAEPAAARAVSYPRTYDGDAGIVVAHTPQIDSWTDFAHVEARAAIAVTPRGEEEAIYGVVEFTADTDPNLELRVVAVNNIKITATIFPVDDDARRSQLDSIVRTTIKKRTPFMPLDVILSYIAPQAKLPEEPGLSYAPPPIFYSTTPAVLMITDGEPLLAPIDDTKLQYAVNTNWDLFRYKDKEWYLRDGSRWLKNKTLSGEWKVDSRLPRDFKKIPADDNWKNVRAAIPPEKGDKTAPTVFVSDRPAELIAIKGRPSYHTIGDAGLRFVANTESDLFMYQNRFYYLVSGRWFSADELRGPWEHVTELPDPFTEIPRDHKKGHVLAAVPGSDEARLATLEAALPRKATVKRNAGQNVSVFYQGEPQFATIPGTEVQRAVNSANDILKVGGTYYLCDNAVWYVSMDANGSWVVADTIPAVIYSIPPSSPSYHMTHVHVYDSDAETVSTGYTSGYVGMHVSYGVVVYGSGWYYPSYYGYYPYYGYPYYPYYYPYPYSYGSSAWYNPNTGMYGRSASVYGPYGGYGRAASYNPKTGTYARGSAVWDSNEIAGSAIAYNPRTGTGVATNRYASENGGWGESLITHNDKWIETQSQWDGNSRNTEFTTSEGGSGQIERQQSGDRVTGSGEFQRGDQSLTTRSVRGEQGTLIGGETGDGTRGAIGRTTDGDFYAGKDGQVYKRDENGWHQRGDGEWNKVEVPDERAAQIDERRGAASERRDTFESRSAENRTARGQEQRTVNRGDAAGRTRAAGAQTNRSPGNALNSGSFDASRRNELNRSRSARTNGYQRYNNRASMQSRGSGRQMRGRGRR